MRLFKQYLALTTLQLNPIRPNRRRLQLIPLKRMLQCILETERLPRLKEGRKALLNLYLVLRSGQSPLVFRHQKAHGDTKHSHVFR